MKLAGHSSLTVSQRYVHPTPESVEFAFDRWALLAQKSTGEKLDECSTPKIPTVCG
jgi:hypothetical protein